MPNHNRGETRKNQTDIINANSVYIHALSELITEALANDNGNLECVSHTIDLIGHLSYEIMLNNALLIDGLKERNNEQL